jgi:sugar phosphate isomerase/epimerase
MKFGIVTSLGNAVSIKDTVDYIEENVKRFLVPDQQQKAFEECLTTAERSEIPVRAACGFIPGDMKSVGPDRDMHKLLAWAETAFTRARKAGTEIIVYGSGGSRRIPDGFSKQKAEEQFAQILSEMAPLAQESGVTIVIEPLNTRETNLVNSLAEGAEIVSRVSHPNVQLLADIYHMAAENEPPEEISKFGSIIKHAHLAEKEGRAAPGTAQFDFVPYFQALRQVSYDSMISIECKWEDITTQAAGAVGYVRSQLGLAEDS